jgi:hypothetical protein
MSTKTQQQTKAAAGSSSLENKLHVAPTSPLAKYGGFAFLESVIDGLSNINPNRAGRREVYLNEAAWQGSRDQLATKLATWLDILKNNNSSEEMLRSSKDGAKKLEDLINGNLLNALDRVRDLERSYRTVALFYKNTESDKVKNVTILNASQEQITDLDNTRFIDYVESELRNNFDRLDLRDNYGILVVPGYMRRNSVIEKWAKIAYNSKAILVTDFDDMETPDDVVDMFSNADHTGGDVYRSNTIMACNWLLGRPKVEKVGEQRDMFIPPSGALAGKIYSTLMSQVVAGKKFGGINEVDGVRFDLKKSEISHMERIGLVPMVYEYSKVMAFSAKTLFNGDNLGLQTYSVVRVFDHITKVLFDFLNRRAFENWTNKTESDLRSQIVKFLDDIKGPDRLIERFKVMRIEQDRHQKDRIYLDIHITPYFPAKSFVIKLDGHKGDSENPEWEAEYAQN